MSGKVARMLLIFFYVRLIYLKVLLGKLAAEVYSQCNDYFIYQYTLNLNDNFTSVMCIHFFLSKALYL